MAIVEDLEQIAPRVVVKYDEIGLGVIAQEFRVTVVGLDDREILEEPRQA